VKALGTVDYCLRTTAILSAVKKMKKLLGLSCGRRFGNSEIVLREALDAARQAGDVEVEIIRLQDLTIGPCIGCISCLMNMSRGGAGRCNQYPDDHFAFVEDKFYECDALIVALPVYALGSTGLFKALCDRFGPSHDAAFAEMNRQNNGGTSDYDDRIFKPRVGAFISVGGAPLANWVSLGIPLMHQLTFSMNVQIVDQMQVLRAGASGQVVMQPDVLARARRLGDAVAANIGKGEGETTWHGDQQGTCPVCHGDLMVIRDGSTIECAICGIEGTLQPQGGGLRAVFSPEEQAKSRLTMAGKRIHFHEINEVTGEFMRDLPEIKGKLQAARRSDIPILTP
jgi:multimeric flavodoxin WrbA